LTRYLPLSTLFENGWFGESASTGVRVPSCYRCFVKATFIELSNHPLLNVAIILAFSALVISLAVAGTKFTFKGEFVAMIEQVYQQVFD
jgi:hypothetical protein